MPHGSIRGRFGGCIVGHWIICNSSAIQAVAAVFIVGLTGLTLIVLKQYADDTKTIARVSVSQLESLHLPFLAVRQEENVPHQIGGWVLENQGSGPAINISYRYHHNGQEIVRQLQSLGPRTPRSVQNDFANAVGSQAGFNIRYESLSGSEYCTLIEWENGVMRIRFQKPD